MNNIKFTLFDLLGYLFPGLFFLIGLFWLIDNTFVSIFDFKNYFRGFQVSHFTVLLIFSYVVGFAIDNPGSWFYYKVACRIGRNPPKDVPKSFKVSRKERLELHMSIRHESPENNQMLQTWKLLKTMSHNLSFVFLCLTFFALDKMTLLGYKNYLEWSSVSAFCLLLSLNLIYRAKEFDKWFFTDLFNSGIALELGKFKPHISTKSTAE